MNSDPNAKLFRVRVPDGTLEDVMSVNFLPRDGSQGDVVVPVSLAELRDYADVMANLIAELSDPGTGALAALYRLNMIISQVSK